MPFIDLPSSPLAPGVSPVRIHYRDIGFPRRSSPLMDAAKAGDGPPIVFLHAGWGYEIYPLDRQLDALAPRHRLVIPDRSGYGRSVAIETLPRDFHQRAVEETRVLIDALGLERPILWGHSDGAIIALKFGLAAPDRIAGLIVEATHYYKHKPGSRAFFEAILADPQSLGWGVTAVLERDHGARWPEVIDLHARRWIGFNDEAASPAQDFYDGRLPELRLPVLVVHGARDPRMEPGELDALRAALDRTGRSGSAPATFLVLPEGGHSPHSERATADEVTRAVEAFFERVDMPHAF